MRRFFQHEPASNVDYSQDVDMDMERLEGDEAEAIKMMTLHRSNVPNNTWNLSTGYDYEWSKPNQTQPF
jgi:hypothetical protein